MIFEFNCVIVEFKSLNISLPLLWRHNGRNGVSNRQPHCCLLNRLFMRRSTKTSKLRVTGLCAANSPVTGEFPAQMASNAENVSIWWRHHAKTTQSVEHSKATVKVRGTPLSIYIYAFYNRLLDALSSRFDIGYGKKDFARHFCVLILNGDKYEQIAIVKHCIS